MLRIGVLGAATWESIHLNCLQQLPASYELIGFYDPDPKLAESVSQEKGIKAWEKLEELVDASDVVDIVTPTLSHFECAQTVLQKGKHLFIEKPVTHTLEEAERLLSRSAGQSRVQVGHVERFNPAFRAIESDLNRPLFIEAHRLAQFNPRGTDVPVVLDLMIHDIDVVLHSVKSEVSNIHASGVAVVSDTPDIANARIEFENGCVANLTAQQGQHEEHAESTLLSTGYLHHRGLS